MEPSKPPPRFRIPTWILISCLVLAVPLTFVGVFLVPSWIFYLNVSRGSAEILKAARTLQANTAMQGQEWVDLPPSMCPKPINNLNPSWVSVSREKVHIEMGGGHFHYGIDCFPEGVTGEGRSKVIDGLWHVSD